MCLLTCVEDFRNDRGETCHRENKSMLGFGEFENLAMERGCARKTRLLLVNLGKSESGVTWESLNPRASMISPMAPQPCPHSQNHPASPWPSRVTCNNLSCAPHNVCVSGSQSRLPLSSPKALERQIA